MPPRIPSKNAPMQALVPDNPAIHRLAAVSPNAYLPYIKPISGGYRLPSRKAKRNGGFPEARTAPNKSRLACFEDRDLRGRGKRANAYGGPMLP
ncbi:conserved hypothetical protein [Mesorhizobium escarrei]|uniref:Uncharacterized protein n=1 Tax=Mesorhizobium escarrei TaxID=666018 RepID=A0ABN8KCU6_9HYPH|nr:conserved hypothetical protein [Mesorhizobium escarrei]